MNFTYTIADLSADEWQQLEWLDTNGIGGWAGSTITGCNTRRYHGLLVASLPPSMQRLVMLSKLDEKIIAGNQTYELGTNDYRTCLHPFGYQYLKTFTKNIFPEFLYEAGNIQLKKTIAAIYGENTVVIKYEVLQADNPFTFQLFPFTAARDYHTLAKANSQLQKEVKMENNVWQCQPYPDKPSIFIQAAGSQFFYEAYWYYHFHYSIETYRGLDAEEDLWNPGFLEKTLQPGEEFFILLSTNDITNKDGRQLFEQENNRRNKLIQHENDVFRQTLLLAADQFIVRKPNHEPAIIAGYHWFTDWGRDTMISLPGLCFFTGHVDIGKEILWHYIQYLSKGMVPNRFPDYNMPPEYNTIDASLWLIIAGYYYYRQTKDIDFVKENLLPACEQILTWYQQGTSYNIHADEDSLLSGGEQGFQLTWMDAKIGNWVVTPRMGKPVEINALWYNAWKIYAHFLQLSDNLEKAGEYENMADKVKKNFQSAFWNESKQCLYDVIDGQTKDDSIRPNQLFAISLPFPLFEGEQAEKILTCITNELYTPKGLRSLSPSDPQYHPHYGGDQQQRDAAYHQGTVWAYLSGAYIDAMIKIKKDGKEQAEKILQNLLPAFREAGIGTISEIFDAEPPFTARGCVAQAWSIGELIRVVKMYELKIDHQNQ